MAMTPPTRQNLSSVTMEIVLSDYSYVAQCTSWVHSLYC